jgi:N-acetylmuramoyl-L-alanine amidase
VAPGTVAGMRRLLLTLTFSLMLSSPAVAAVPHVVQPGETLWSIASSNGFTTRSFAAYNGLSEDSQVVLGSTLQIPSVDEAAAALAQTAAPAPMGGYIVQPGDTLTGLAAQAGVPVEQMAAMNGLEPDAFLIAGAPLKMPTGAPVATTAAAPSTVPAADPAPTATRVTSGDIATVATRNGVPADLASAVAWQESGFNNAMVSSANARGVMQVMPGTWDWVQQNLAKRQLDPNNAIDNVGAGVLYLGRMLQESGGDPALAAAGYYQGMASVQRIGMLPETRQYVANVMALRSRFAG